MRHGLRLPAHTGSWPCSVSKPYERPIVVTGRRAKAKRSMVRRRTHEMPCRIKRVTSWQSWNGDLTRHQTRCVVGLLCLMEH